MFLSIVGVIAVLVGIIFAGFIDDYRNSDEKTEKIFIKTVEKYPDLKDTDKELFKLSLKITEYIFIGLAIIGLILGFIGYFTLQNIV